MGFSAATVESAGGGRAVCSSHPRRPVAVGSSQWHQEIRGLVLVQFQVQLRVRPAAVAASFFAGFNAGPPEVGHQPTQESGTSSLFAVVAVAAVRKVGATSFWGVASA